MKNIIIGAGEVGKSLYEVLKGAHETLLRDVEPLPAEGIEVLNICFPPSDRFELAVKKYQAEYNPKLTIIHSSVPVGTSRRLGAVHSPIHGKHPNLSQGILTFRKYIGGEDPKAVRLAAKFLKAAGIKTKVVSSPEASELSKLLCTTRYGWEIVFMKEVEKICKKFKVPFEEIYNWSKWYNQGYRKLGMPQFTRAILKPMPGKTGGHCVLENCRLLSEEFVSQTILARNKIYEEDSTQ